VILSTLLYLTLLGAVLRLVAAVERGLANRPPLDTALTARQRRVARTDALNATGNLVAVILVLLLIAGVTLR
jgi:hypothetical protein